MTYVFKGKPAPAPEAAPCGTYGGYQTHKRYGTTPCGPCRQANASYSRATRRRLGRTTSTLIPIDTQCPNCGHHITKGAA